MSVANSYQAVYSSETFTYINSFSLHSSPSIKAKYKSPQRLGDLLKVVQLVMI